MEVGGILRSVRVSYEGGAPLTGVVALRTFNLDDIGTQIGERLASPRTGKNSRQLNDLHAF